VTIKIKTPENNLDSVTKFYIDSNVRPLRITRQADCSVVIPENTDTEGFLVVTTDGTEASLGSILYDNGLSEGTMKVVDAEIGLTIACSSTFSGGTVELDGCSIYLWNTEWIKIGDISNYTNALRAVRIILNTDAMQESTFEVPANSYIQKIIFLINNAYSESSFVTIGHDEDADVLVNSTEINVTIARLIILKKNILWPLAKKIRVTVGGTPIVGSGSVIVLFS
jgi:hypothetical protein